MIVRCGTCGDLMGDLAPLDNWREIRGLCSECAPGSAAAFEGARSGVRILDQVLARGDADVVRWLAGELARLQGDVWAGLRPVTLRAPVAARRARA